MADVQPSPRGYELVEPYYRQGPLPKAARGLVRDGGVPEELAFAHVPYRAFLSVHFEFEPLLQELGHARHHPLSSRFRLHVNVTVVRIPAKPVTAFFQFLVAHFQFQNFCRDINRNNIAFFHQGNGSAFGCFR